MNKDGKSYILVIDDNEDILTMLQAMLQHAGYAVTTLDGPENLFQTIAEHRPDLILMDKLLSGADGCEYCEKLKADAEFIAIPVVMMSAHPQAQVECLAAGADFFIEKPFEMNHMLQTIANAINPI